MATDYDAPRRSEADELGEGSLEELKARRAEAQSSSVDVDETDFNENLELPGADPGQMTINPCSAPQLAGAIEELLSRDPVPDVGRSEVHDDGLAVLVV